MYIIIKLLLANIFVTVIIYVIRYIQTISFIRFLVICYHSLLCCVLQYKILLGMLQRNTPNFTFTILPILLLSKMYLVPTNQGGME